MKPLLSIPVVRGLVAAVVMMSWLVLSNHCALGLMSAPSAAEHAGCCGQDSSTKGGGPSPPAVRECCQSMQALAPGVPWAVAPSQFLMVLGPWLASEMRAADAVAPVGIVRVLETGPPGARSFAELVLRHGVRSHAPPVGVRS